MDIALRDLPSSTLVEMTTYVNSVETSWFGFYNLNVKDLGQEGFCAIQGASLSCGSQSLALAFLASGQVKTNLTKPNKIK